MLHPARCGPRCAYGFSALVLRRGDKRHGRNTALDRVEAIPDGLMLGPILSARQHNDGAAGGVCFALFGCARSEEHTSELQSLMRISYAVFCLKKTINNKRSQISNTHTHTCTIE